MLIKQDYSKQDMNSSCFIDNQNVKEIEPMKKLIVVLALLYLAVVLIGLVGKHYFALNAVFILLIGVIIGMVIFKPNKGD